MDVAVRAMSLPVVVIVHVTQQPPAEANIFWDNGFSEPVSMKFVNTGLLLIFFLSSVHSCSYE